MLWSWINIWMNEQHQLHLSIAIKSSSYFGVFWLWLFTVKMSHISIKWTLTFSLQYCTFSSKIKIITLASLELLRTNKMIWILNVKQINSFFSYLSLKLKLDKLHTRSQVHTGNFAYMTFSFCLVELYILLIPEHSVN